MTVDGLREWLYDGDLFVNDNQEVLFSYNGAVLEIDGTDVPESGPVKVILRPVRQHNGRCGMSTFTVRHEWVVAKNYEIEACTAEEAVAKLRSKIDSGEVCVWKDGYETTDTEYAFDPEGRAGRKS